KRLMIATDLARAAILGALPVIAALHLLTVGWLYLASFLIATLSYCFNTAEFAAIPHLVAAEDLVEANGRIQATYSAAAVIGPLLAGLIVTILPLPALLWFDAASFLISTGSLAWIKAGFNRDELEEHPNLWTSMIDGIRYVVGHPVLRNICLMMALVNFLAITTVAQLVLYARRQLGASDPQIAWLFAAGSIGAVIFSLLAGRLRKLWPFSRVALGAILLYGLLTASLAIFRQYVPALIAWAAISGLGVLFNVNFSSLWQGIVPDRLLGRVLSVATVMAWAANPLGSLLGGVAIQRTNDVALVYGVCGLLIGAVAFSFIFSPIGHAERYLTQPIDANALSPEQEEGLTLGTEPSGDPAPLR
ncbi:MAG TPA: MFS transporter, partial [Ktedonobacterales bacterium]|nr:MFS transporter [Ktedonobacterales bacterium]